MNILDSLILLEKHIIKEDYKGYDPYDTLNSWLPFKSFGKWCPILATQIQKRNPINIRPLIGIKKGFNPKAMGLFLKAYSMLYKKTNNNIYLKKADYFYNWLINNYTKEYSGICWGYNFPWASSSKYLEAYIPSAVVTGFIIKGMREYYNVSCEESVLDIVSSASKFIQNDLEWTKDNSDVCISYTPLLRDICYNASLLGAEVLATNYELNHDKDSRSQAIAAVDYVIDKQKDNGVWAYSKDINSTNERIQIDFHQGYVLESIFNIMEHVDNKNQKWENSIKIGLEYYRKNQFNDDGISLWRLPKKYPVEIHNQAQGIITFSHLVDYFCEGAQFADIIANWTIINMQDRKGYFYYQKRKLFTIKIPYTRWGQAWMFLALSYIMCKK